MVNDISVSCSSQLVDIEVLEWQKGLGVVQYHAFIYSD